MAILRGQIALNGVSDHEAEDVAAAGLLMAEVGGGGKKHEAV